MRLNDYLKETASCSWMSLFGARGEFKNLVKDTAFVVENALSVEVCNELIFLIDQLIEEGGRNNIWCDATGSDARILGFEDHIPTYINEFNIEKNISLVDKYTGRKTRSWFLMANRLRPEMNNLGSGGGMHRDSPFSHQVKCIWYLSDVGTENGPFQYVPNTNIHLIKKRSKFPLGKTRYHNLTEDIVEVHGEAGAMLVCDTKCIHGGKPIAKGSRYAVTLYTLPRVGGKEAILRKSGIY